jgi:hypothetical protein
MLRKAPQRRRIKGTQIDDVRVHDPCPLRRRNGSRDVGRVQHGPTHSAI